MKNKVILIGYMGSGKSVVARELAKIKGYNFLDLDMFIEKKEGNSVAVLFKAKGEIYFRKQERKYLREILDSSSPFILSLGGGTPCYGDNLDMIKSHEDTVIVYLSTGLNTLTKRLFDERKLRPLIAHLKTVEELNDFIRKHLFERSYYYSQADITVVTDGKSVNEISDEILDRLF